MNDPIQAYLNEVKQIAEKINASELKKLVHLLLEIRKGKGRIFFLGVGGSAANASHAVNDFRKICGFEAYAPTDNISELTARVNDEGWETVFEKWLQTSRLSVRDLIFIFSVGGGDAEKKVSVNLIRAVDYAKKVGAKVAGIVGRDGGYTGKKADAAVVIPVVNADKVTAHTEAFQAVLWHLLVSHPDLQVERMKWETLKQS